MTISNLYDLSAQDLLNLRWKNRVILILAHSETNNLVERQKNELNKDLDGFTERKLKAFMITSEYNSDLFQSYKKSESDFEVVLIGLDGGVKERRTDVFPLAEMFAIIDGMPMRRAEMENR